MHKDKKVVPIYTFEDLSIDELKILDYVRRYKRISSNELANKFNLKKRVVDHILKSLDEKLFIDRFGIDKRGYWFVIRIV